MWRSLIRLVVASCFAVYPLKASAITSAYQSANSSNSEDVKTSILFNSTLTKEAVAKADVTTQRLYRELDQESRQESEALRRAKNFETDAKQLRRKVFELRTS